ncbi:restriction endonuclease [Corynebacterium sp. LK32]|uniref:restriction endonuclease PLD domain-containing protein n=1 Tax=Corynebacterium sp. LK32 TaxID=2044575 RepID=UPI0016522A35|nr:restriction endonuclease PLD domain-containing protein [Corynebacterium sp. LK32]MBC6829896.1 restriction endonuclease [Corynebacterium sp. LK32]
MSSIDVNLVNNSVNAKADYPLSDVFLQQISKAHAIDIAVGYISETSLKYLQEQIEAHSEVELRLVCGMHASEGMTKSQVTHAKALHNLLQEQGRGGVYLTPKASYHGKLYRFEHEGFDSAYIGSSNLSGIVPKYSETFELGVYIQESPLEINSYWNNVIEPLMRPMHEVDVPIITNERSPMWDVDEAKAVSTSYVANVMASPVKYTFEIPLKVNPKSSLNAHMGGDGKRKNKTTGLNRSWFEGELIVDKGIRTEGYPKTGTSFTVVTDDGWEFECRISGADGKNLRSKGKLSTFGTWMKSRLIEAGAIEFGELANESTLKRFGRKTMTMRYHSEIDVWSFDLSNIQQ